MGYYVKQMESFFILERKNEKSAFEALKRAFEEENKIGLINAETLLKCKTFKEAMSICNWDLEGSDKVYDGISFNCNKLDPDDSEIVILNAIAPYVNNGSYIQMQGEEGKIWRWVFDNGRVVIKNAAMSWAS